MTEMTVDSIVKKLETFFSDKGGKRIEPDDDTPMGAATFHAEGTFIPCFSSSSEFLHFRQVCVRPFDDMNDVDPSRNNVFMQYQCVIKPSCIGNLRALDIARDSLANLGICAKNHLIEVINDNWQSPSMGAFGVGWEIRVDGLEVMQVTYMFKLGDCILDEKVMELAFGIDRISMILQKKKSITVLDWDDDSPLLKEYKQAKIKFIDSVLDNDFQILNKKFKDAIAFNNLEGISLPYNPKLRLDVLAGASNMFNIMDAMVCLKDHERDLYIDMLRKEYKKVAEDLGGSDIIKNEIENKVNVSSFWGEEHCFDINKFLKRETDKNHIVFYMIFEPFNEVHTFARHLLEQSVKAYKDVKVFCTGNYLLCLFDKSCTKSKRVVGPKIDVSSEVIEMFCKKQGFNEEADRLIIEKIKGVEKHVIYFRTESKLLEYSKFIENFLLKAKDIGLVFDWGEGLKFYRPIFSIYMMDLEENTAHKCSLFSDCLPEMIGPILAEAFKSINDNKPDPNRVWLTANKKQVPVLGKAISLPEKYIEKIDLIFSERTKASSFKAEAFVASFDDCRVSISINNEFIKFIEEVLDESASWLEENTGVFYQNIILGHMYTVCEYLIKSCDLDIQKPSYKDGEWYIDILFQQKITRETRDRIEHAIKCKLSLIRGLLKKDLRVVFDTVKEKYENSVDSIDAVQAIKIMCKEFDSSEKGEKDSIYNMFNIFQNLSVWRESNIFSIYTFCSMASVLAIKCSTERKSSDIARDIMHTVSSIGDLMTLSLLSYRKNNTHLELFIDLEKYAIVKANAVFVEVDKCQKRPHLIRRTIISISDEICSFLYNIVSVSSELDLSSLIQYRDAILSFFSKINGLLQASEDHSSAQAVILKSLQKLDFSKESGAYIFIEYIIENKIVGLDRDLALYLTFTLSKGFNIAEYMLIYSRLENKKYISTDCKYDKNKKVEVEELYAIYKIVEGIQSEELVSKKDSELTEDQMINMLCFVNIFKRTVHQLSLERIKPDLLRIAKSSSL